MRSQTLKNVDAIIEKLMNDSKSSRFALEVRQKFEAVQRE